MFSFPAEQMGGVIAVNVFAIFCGLALASVGLRAVWLGIKSRKASKPQEYVFFNTQLGNYAACLLVAMFFNTVAGIIGVRWLANKGITPGAVCTAQGLLLQMGTWSSGYFTVSIAIHTFNCLVLKKRQSAMVSRATMGFGWALALLMSAIPFFVPKTDGDVYGPNGFLCSIRPIYPKLQFCLHILPILVASILSAVFYSITYLVLRGTVNIKGGIKLALDPHQRWSSVTSSDHYQKFIARIARSMVWYPVAYIALLVPYSIMKMLVISGFPVPFEALVFATTCWFALGVVNVFLFYNTFRILEPAFDGTSYANSRRDVESSGMFEKDYSKSFRPRPLPDSREKGQYQVPVPYRIRSMDSLTSEDGLIPSHEKNGSISNPQRTLHKAEALAHSPKSSISSQGYVSPSQLFRAPLPSASNSRNASPNASPTIASLQRGDSISYGYALGSPTQLSPRSPAQTYNGATASPPGSEFGAAFARPRQTGRKSPPRQLSLVGDQQTPSPRATVTRLPTLSRSRNNSPPQRPLVLPNRQSNGSEFGGNAFTNPRRVPPISQEP